MKQNKGQGSLEYLIIIAAVLAIAAIVVLFLTGAFKSSGGDVAACKAAAASCANDLATSNNQAPCAYCDTQCDATMGVTGYDDAIQACKAGDPEAIYNNATG